MLPEIRIQPLVGGRGRRELLSIADDKRFELGELAGILPMAGEPFQLRVREADPLTEGNVQSSSVVAAVELGRSQVCEFPQLAVQLHVLQGHTEHDVAL